MAQTVHQVSAFMMGKIGEMSVANNPAATMMNAILGNLPKLLMKQVERTVQKLKTILPNF